MSDPFAGAGVPGGQQPSEEEMRAALGQMRAQPVEGLVAEVVSALLNSAQVKLGRNDGRLLLDLSALLNDATRGQVDENLTSQVDDALSQLRMAQVQAEQEVVVGAQQGHVEQNDLPRRPAPLKLASDGAADEEAGTAAPEGDQPSVAADAPPAAPQQPAPGSAASRLWVPGR